MSFLVHRPVGFDIKQGETLLTAGEKLGPAELGLLAMAGVNTVRMGVLVFL